MEKLSALSFDIGPIRPPSEGGSYSLLIRVTRNCPWNRCRFCYGIPYHRERFELRSIEAIKHDIDTAKKISDEINRVSQELGHGGKANGEVGTAMIRSDPALNTNHSFVTVFNWIASSGRSAFLQDADSLVIKTPDMIEVIQYLKKIFPSLTRITTYARAKTVFRKSPEDLRALHDAGLTRLHIGLESGDDEVLSSMEKGVTSEQHIIAGKKAKEAGFQLSVYVMPGLGGREMSQQHALNTARVLNTINPDYIRFRSFIPRPNTPLGEAYLQGNLEVTSPHERLIELKILITAVEVTSHVCFDHFMNSWRNHSGKLLFTQDYEGYQFPQEKQKVLDLIEEGLSIDESMHVHAKDLVGLGL